MSLLKLEERIKEYLGQNLSTSVL